jgi:translation elongation factor EF-Tu-like GTPase
MKIIVIGMFTLLIIISLSCKADKETVSLMAAEMCAALESFDSSNPTSILVTTDALQKLEEHSERYRKVTEKQLINAMKELCPDGYSKLNSINSSGAK